MSIFLVGTDNIIRNSTLSETTTNPNTVQTLSQFPKVEDGAPVPSYFYTDEKTITRNFGTSLKYKCDIAYVQNPTSGSGARYRVEDMKRSPLIRTTHVDQFFSFSIYVPTTTNILTMDTMTLYQWHAGESNPFGSPSWRFDVRKQDGFDVMTVTMRWGNSPTSTNQMRFTLGRLVKGQWYDFVGRHTWDYSLSAGNSVFWMNGEVAKAYSLDGGTQVLIGTGANSQDAAGTGKGSFATVGSVSVFDWTGRTVYPPDQYNKNNKYPKWGLMSSNISIGNGYYASTSPWALTNTTNSEAPNYIDLDLYGYGKADFIFDNVNWDTRNIEDWRKYEAISYNRTQPSTFPERWEAKPIDPDPDPEPTPTIPIRFRGRKQPIV
jgi:hypothetical protein